MEVTYKAGQKEGAWSEWYENGKRRAKGSYAADKPDGKLSFWYDDGKPWAIKHYAKGIEDGKWSEWDREGHPIPPDFQGDCASGDRVSSRGRLSARRSSSFCRDSAGWRTHRARFPRHVLVAQRPSIVRHGRARPFGDPGKGRSLSLPLVTGFVVHENSSNRDRGD